MDEGEEADELELDDNEAVEELCEFGELGVDELLLSLPLLLDEPSLLGLLSELPLLSDAVLVTSVFSPLFSDLASGSLSLSE